MKKYLIILLSTITIHTHAMETENNTNIIVPINLKKYPIDVLDLIAQFLPFHDYETEKEFIERTQTLTIKELPEKCPIYFSIKYSAYSPNNTIIAASEKDTFSNYDLVQSSERSYPQVCIVNRKTNQKKNYDNIIGNFYQKLAVSNDGNLVATLYLNHTLNPSTRISTAQYALCINNFSTKKEEAHNLPLSFKLCDKHPTIAFNKQSTDIIVHGENSQHIIFPLTINTPNPDIDHKKTLTKYFAQQGICKDLIAQISAKK